MTKWIYRIALFPIVCCNAISHSFAVNLSEAMDWWVDQVRRKP